jgi:uncharacterized membrane protein
MVKKIRGYFFTGLIILMPLLITWRIVLWLFIKVDKFLDRYLAFWLKSMEIPYIRGYGFIAVFLIILLAGIIARNYLGRKFFQLAETVVKKIPFINTVYRVIQQISNAFLTRNKKLFSFPVLIEYPKKDSWVIGFVTRAVQQGEIREVVREDLYSIFVPTTPNPTSGFLLFLPKKDVIELKMSVEEAVKLVVSGGMVTPETAIPLGAEVSETVLLDKIKEKRM